MKRAMQLKRPLNHSKNGNASHTAQPIKRSLSFSRFALLVVALLGSAAGAWAFCEFVVWNRLPAELVGKWIVEGGPQDGAIFDFYRSGKLHASFENNGMEEPLEGTVEVRDKTLSIITHHRITRAENISHCQIRELTPMTLIVEFDKGEVYKMARAR